MKRWIPATSLWRRVLTCPGGTLAVYRFERKIGSTRTKAAKRAFAVGRIYLSGTGLGRWS